jgi:putative membrane protein
MGAGRSALATSRRLRVDREVQTLSNDSTILAIERPDRSLWTYYMLSLLVFPPLFPVLILPAWFRYSTMRYRFTEEGISMRWGVLFRREIIVNYARIQDIHLHSNVVERWLGLARVMIQTASGSASAEMTLEGFKNFEDVRDFLYSKMRGMKDQNREHITSGGPGSGSSPELAAILQEVTAELRKIRHALEGRPAPPPLQPPESPRDV